MSRLAPGNCAHLTPYDAAYVALAELLSAPLVTSDGRLARATGPRCVIELIQAGRADSGGDEVLLSRRMPDAAAPSCGC